MALPVRQRFRRRLEWGGKDLRDWQNQSARLDVVFDSPDSAALARQVGLKAKPLAGDDAGAHIEVHGSGVPKDGVDMQIDAEVAGLKAKGTGKVTLAPNVSPAFTGDLSLSSIDAAPVLALGGIAVPEVGGALPIDLAGSVALGPAGGEIEWKDGHLGASTASGKVSAVPAGDGSLRLTGDLAVDTVDLGWLLSLGLGSSPLPGGDPASPWPKVAFDAPALGALSGKFTIATQQVSLGGETQVSGGTLSVALLPQRIDVDLAGGHLAGGEAKGNVSINNVGGNAHLFGQFDLHGAALQSLVWQAGGVPVAAGTIDLSGNIEATGRSAPALAASTTGGGVIDIHDGEVRYVDPNVARQLVHASDLGEEFTDDALRARLEQQIGAGTFAFGEAGGAFAIAAGAVRLGNVTVRGDGVEATGGGVIDLNAMKIASDWTLTFDVGDSDVEGATPKIGLVFKGPLGSPERIIDPVPFAAYLNVRREGRLLQILASETADRAERERLDRVVVRLRDDHARVSRLAAESRAAAQRQADDAAAAKAAAEKAAAEAVQRAKDARAAADKAAAALGPLVKADEAATATLAKASAARDEAAAKAQPATAAGGEASAAVDAAEDRLREALAVEADARGQSVKAERDRATTDLALQVAKANLATARDALSAATDAALEANAQLAPARAAAEESAKRLAAAQADEKQTLAALTAARESAGDVGSDAASKRAADADRHREQFAAAAKVAADDAAVKNEARESARLERDAAEAALKAAETAYAEVQKVAPEGDVHLLGRKAELDSATVAATRAHDAYTAAEQAAGAAVGKASMAKAAFDEAANQAAAADAQAARAAEGARSLAAAEAEHQRAAQEAVAAAASAKEAADALAEVEGRVATAASDLTTAETAATAASDDADAAQGASDKAAAAADKASAALAAATSARGEAFAAAKDARARFAELSAAADAASAMLAQATTAYEAAEAEASRAQLARAAAEKALQDATTVAGSADKAVVDAKARAKAAAIEAERAARNAEKVAAAEEQSVIMPTLRPDAGTPLPLVAPIQ